MVWVLSRLLKYYLAVRGERRRQEETARVADAETMKEHIWEGDNVYSKGKPGNIEERIQMGLARVRAQRKSGNSLAGTTDDQNPTIL